MIKKIIALILVPFIFIITNELTSIKDTNTLSFQINENNTLTTDTYNNLLALKDNKNYSIARAYNITNDDLETSRLKIDDTVKNEIVDNILIENVSLIDLNEINKITVNDKHYFYNFINSYNIKQLNQVYTDLNLIENVNVLNITSEKLADVTIYGKSSVKVKQSEIDIANKLNIPVYLENNQYLTKVKEKILLENDYYSLVTIYTNLDYIEIAKPTDSLVYGVTDKTNAVILEGYTDFASNTNDDISNVGKFSTNKALNYIRVGFPKGTTLVQAKTQLIGKKLTYQLTTPRLALTDGITDIVNPKIKSESQDKIKSTEISFIETLASIPNTLVTDEIKPLANGLFEITKKVKTVKLWEYGTSIGVVSNTNTYRFNFTQFHDILGLKGKGTNTVGFINTFIGLVDTTDNRHQYTGFNELYLYIEKPLIDQQTGSTLTDKLKTYLQANNITFKGELATYQKYTITPTGNQLLELYQNGVVTTDSPIKLNYTDYLKPNSNINENFTVFKDHLYYTGELQKGLFEINQTERPTNTYELTNSNIKYDVLTKKITIDLNDNYNTIEISKDDTYKEINGYEVLNNNYEITYYEYQIPDPYVREFIKLVPLIYIGVALVYILMFKER